MVLKAQHEKRASQRCRWENEKADGLPRVYRKDTKEVVQAPSNFSLEIVLKNSRQRDRQQMFSLEMASIQR